MQQKKCPFGECAVKNKNKNTKQLLLWLVMPRWENPKTDAVFFWVMNEKLVFPYAIWGQLFPMVV